MPPIVAELVANTDPGDLIMYETLADALDLDEKDDSVIRSGRP